MGRGRSPVGGGGGKAKEFPDKAESGSWAMEYKGSGAEQVKFFAEKSNCTQLLDEAIKNGDKEAFRAWTRGDFMGGEQYLPFDDMGRSDRAATYALDQYMDRGKLSEALTVYRGSTGELLLGKGHRDLTLEQAKAMKGQFTSSKSMMATGVASEGLPISGSGRDAQVEYKIRLPKGKAGVGCWVGDRRVNDWGPRQREFVTSRDSIFKIGDSYKKGSKLVVELEWVGQGKHDYGSGGVSAAKKTYNERKSSWR